MSTEAQTSKGRHRAIYMRHLGLSVWRRNLGPRKDGELEGGNVPGVSKTGYNLLSGVDFGDGRRIPTPGLGNGAPTITNLFISGRTAVKGDADRTLFSAEAGP